MFTGTGESRGWRRSAVAVALAVLALTALAGGAVAGAKVITGSDIAAEIFGTNKKDTIHGGSGGERIFGRGGPDLIQGNGGDDDVWGGGGDDRAFGGDGEDVVTGGPGADTEGGGPGRDYFNATVDGDQLAQGSEGNDQIWARDGQADVINCGAGYDVVYVDRIEDGVFDCEEMIAP